MLLASDILPEAPGMIDEWAAIAITRMRAAVRRRTHSAGHDRGVGG